MKRNKTQRLVRNKNNQLGLDISVIPKGYYCYAGFKEATKHRPFVVKHGICPYWGVSPNHHYQESGYCRFLGVGDWDDSAPFLLWDMVKECGENHYTDEEKIDKYYTNDDLDVLKKEN